MRVTRFQQPGTRFLNPVLSQLTSHRMVYRGSLTPKFTKFENKCPLVIPLMVSNFQISSSIERNVRHIRYRKFLLPEKRTIVHQNNLRSATRQCPRCAKFHRTRPNDVGGKRYKTSLHPSVFWRPSGTLLGRSSPISALICTPRAALTKCQILSPSDSLSIRDICCRTSLISLKV